MSDCTQRDAGTSPLAPFPHLCDVLCILLVGLPHARGGRHLERCVLLLVDRGGRHGEGTSGAEELTAVNAVMTALF